MPKSLDEQLRDIEKKYGNVDKAVNNAQDDGQKQGQKGEKKSLAEVLKERKKRLEDL